MKPVGGRGKTAPYISTHVRVPVPVKHIVELVIDRYRQRLEKGEIQPVIADDSSEYLKDGSDSTKALTSYEGVNKAVEILQESLKLKANNGSAIKKEIKKALEFLKD